MRLVKLNDILVDIDSIVKVDMKNINLQEIYVTIKDDPVSIKLTGFDVLELLWLIKPSTLEGNPDIRFVKHSWSIHNLIAHPIMQILSYLRLYKWAIFVHDITIPKPQGFKQKKRLIPNL